MRQLNFLVPTRDNSAVPTPVDNATMKVGR
ncbi:hypothetical protein CCUG60885_04196 [Mycobacteroides salmoniphilum]|uniref:Uncharacterized protein n=1 Tax=Mycobacteroides salmoniphilum TaxID=404941 RepID=A0A4R8SBX3_9MYCO|nr:hypothetical protein CCUG60885_04196 [Mycobacteroides salmoniphilum]